MCHHKSGKCVVNPGVHPYGLGSPTFFIGLGSSPTLMNTFRMQDHQQSSLILWKKTADAYVDVMHAPWITYNPHIHARAYHVCFVSVKCMHMHLHCICVLIPTLVENKYCRCICRHGMHTMGRILSTKLTSTKLGVVRKMQVHV